MAVPSAVSLIAQIPTFVSPEQHHEIIQTTPSSFGDIPPVLRFTQSNVSVHIDPPLEGLTEAELSSGTLHIIESVLAFISSTPSKGFQITYRNITLHAISRSEEKPYLYCQLDDNPDATEEEADAQDYEPQIRDLKIVPEDPSSLEPMFEALSICAALHPDRNTEGEGMEGDEDDDDAFVDVGSGGFETFTGAPGEELSEVGRAALAHLESVFANPESLEDAEGDQEEGEAEEEEGNSVEEAHVNGTK